MQLINVGSLRSTEHLVRMQCFWLLVMLRAPSTGGTQDGGVILAALDADLSSVHERLFRRIECDALDPLLPLVGLPRPRQEPNGGEGLGTKAFVVFEFFPCSRTYFTYGYPVSWLRHGRSWTADVAMLSGPINCLRPPNVVLVRSTACQIFGAESRPAVRGCPSCTWSPM